eukprot:EC096947.1.p2 GENE.EC096947.1~~EC096947.1.p2  ORF type:complete len:123 (+),score=2.15 EC096947.1:72-440(+)
MFLHVDMLDYILVHCQQHSLNVSTYCTCFPFKIFSTVLDFYSHRNQLQQLLNFNISNKQQGFKYLRYFSFFSFTKCLFLIKLWNLFEYFQFLATKFVMGIIFHCLNFALGDDVFFSFQIVSV